MDFGIVIEGETINELREELCKASLGYLETIIKEKLDDSLLNNRAEKKYFDLYEKLLKNELKEVEDKKPSNTKNLIDYYLDSMSIKNLSDICYA